MQRIAVVGNSGSGKSTLAAELARRLDLEHIELDALYHGPNWQEPDPADFRVRVRVACAGDRWVTCGNYGSKARDIVWTRADTVVFLDYPRRVVMARIVRRSVARVVWREELWNGNRERWRNLLAWDPEESIIRWSWTQHARYREQYRALLDDERWSHLRFVWLRTPRATAAWLQALG